MRQIKRMMGKGATTIRVTTLGIVTDVGDEDGRIYVNWIDEGLDRVVDSRGCFKSIHGPFEEGDGWTQQVFCL